MPRFLVYAPDYPDCLDRRLAVRPQHLERAKQDQDSKLQIYGSPFRPRPGTSLHDAPLPADVPRIAGSFMVYTFPTLENCWTRIKGDVYWTEGVWDKEKLFVEQLYDSA